MKKRLAGCQLGRRRANDDIFRIEQQRSGTTIYRPCVNEAGKGKILLAGNLDQSAAALDCATACAYASLEDRAVVRPNDDLASVTALRGIGPQRRIRPDVGMAGVLDSRVLALIIASDQDGAAAGGAHDIDRTGDAQIRTEHFYRTARARGTGRIEFARHLHAAALEHDLAAHQRQACGADDPAVIDHPV